LNDKYEFTYRVFIRRHGICIYNGMSRKAFSDQLIDCALGVALFAIPGMTESDAQIKEAYKNLFKDLLKQQQRQLQRVIPFRQNRF
jgi:hypothetical protein